MNIKIGASVVSIVLLAVIIFVWFGIFNVSATDKHWGITNSLLELVRERSIEVRSKDIDTPNLDDLEMISKGAKNYDAMCVQCHLAPGEEPTELYRGLYPQPPVFHNPEHPLHDPSAIYWTVKNGIKMTGMPAWGAFHTEEQLWQMVAFVSKLDGMSSEEYRELVGEGGHSHGDEEHHDEDASNGSNNDVSMGVEKIEDVSETPPAHVDDGHTH